MIDYSSTPAEKLGGIIGLIVVLLLAYGFYRFMKHAAKIAKEQQGIKK